MWFEKMGIYGMQDIEDIIIAGIAIGDPVLLIGSHGTAKTTLCRKLAESLNLKFHAYDASKALFEDIIGFPNPDSISKGKIEYVPTTLSIWDKEFILIDEISRARAESQNKWLEVIRSRKIMGLKIECLKYVFAAMNPPSYLGANPLDEALAGRFTFIVKIPTVVEMKVNDVCEIINNINEDDGRALAQGNEKKLNKKDKEEFNKFIVAIRSKIKELNKDKDLNLDIDSYLIKFMRFADTKGLTIDGRRLNMAKRNILAYISILLLKDKNLKLDFKNLSDHIFYAMKHTMPFNAFDADFTDIKIRYLHDISFDFVDDKIIGGVFNIKTVEDVMQLDNYAISRNYPAIKSVITKIISNIKGPDNMEKKPLYIKILRSLIKRICDGEIKLENNDIERLFETYKYLFDMSFINDYKYSGLQFYAENLIQGNIENDKNDIDIFKIVYNLLRNERQDIIDEFKLKKSLKIFKDFFYKEKED